MPVQITVTVRGMEIVRSNLVRVKTAIANVPAEIIRPELDTARDELVNPYPDEIPGQTYERTGKRGRATRVEAYKGNNQYQKSYTLISDPTYEGGRTADPYVLGNARGDGQAWMHRGRWQTAYAAVNRAMERIQARVVAMLEAFHAEGGL